MNTDRNPCTQLLSYKEVSLLTNHQNKKLIRARIIDER